MIHIKDLTLIIQDRTIFKHASTSFSNEHTGLVGDNGSGKSSLLKTITGEIAPTSGCVLTKGRIGYMRQEQALRADQTVGDFLGYHKVFEAFHRMESGVAELSDFDLLEGNWELITQFTKVFQSLGIQHIPPSELVYSLSGGMIMRVELARLLLGDYDFVLLDEPTNHLDAEGRMAVFQFLEHFQGGTLVVSHDRELLNRMDSIVEIRDARFSSYGGNYCFYRKEKEKEWTSASRKVTSEKLALKKLKEKIQHHTEKQQKRSNLGGKKAGKSGIPKIVLGAMRDRSQGTSAKLSRLKERLIDQRQESFLRAKENLEIKQDITIVLPKSTITPGKIMIDTQKLSFAYSVDKQHLIRDFNLQVLYGEKVHIAGRNASGKSTLLQLLRRTLQPTSGKISGSITQGKSVAYLDQHTTFKHDERTIYETFSDFSPLTHESKKRIILAEFLFPSEVLGQKVATLSGGERTRLSLACILSSEPAKSILLLDEPTNHMDLRSIGVVESALRQYKGTILVVSHDKEFVENIGCKRTVTLDGVSYRKT